jgi:TolA-binding protein
MNERASCPRFVEIGRAVSPEDVPALRQHLDECVYCQSQWAATRKVAEAIRQLPIKAPEAARRQQTRDALVLAATQIPSRRVSPRWAQAAVYVAVGLGAAGVLAAVGTVAVPWLHRQRERIPAAADRDHGRPHAKAKAESGSAPESGTSIAPAVVLVEPIAAASTESPAPRIRETSSGRSATGRRSPGALASLSPAVPSPNSTHLPSPAELAFSEGWQAFHALDYPRAAAAMRRAVEAAPGAALAEDARYWEAVALARQGSVAKARAAMEEFLRRSPGSPRAGEVSAMLGWSLVESHEWSAAEQRFRRAEDDRAPAVRESARKGLEVTARMRSRPKTAP